MHRRRLIALAGPVVAGAAAAALLLPHSPSALRDLALGAGAAGPAIALAAWLVLTPAFVPGTLLAAAGGLAFGAPGGAALSVGGAVLGGLAAFLLARTALRGTAERIVARHARLGRLHALLERRGFAAVLAARLMPGVPAAALHYAAGASPVRARAVALALALGALLRTAPYALLGQGLGSGSPASIVLAGASIVLGGGIALVLVRRLRVPLPAA